MKPWKGIAIGCSVAFLAIPSAAPASLPSSGTLTLQGVPAFQSTIFYSATETGKLKNPLVWTACSQNGVRVYGSVNSPGEPFKLGGDSSQWVASGGGSASCTAELYYILNANKTAEWNGHGAQGGVVTLAEISYEASA